MLARCKLQLCLPRMYQKRQDFRDPWTKVSTRLKRFLGKDLEASPQHPCGPESGLGQASLQNRQRV